VAPGATAVAPKAPRGEPRALRHRDQPQQVVDGLDAAAAEAGDLGKAVDLAAAVVGLQPAAGATEEQFVATWVDTWLRVLESRTAEAKRHNS
jgi:hypothetical protein